MASIIRGNDNFDSATAGPITTAGAVGTYMFANNSTYGTIATGSTVAGSTLRPTSAGNPSNTSYTMSGTWRLMGHKEGTNTSYAGTYETSLWVRIS
jgi:hypothetical protein